MPRFAAVALAAALTFGSGLAFAGTLVIANKSDHTVSLVALPSGEVQATLPTGNGPHEVVVSPDAAIAVITDYGAGTPGNSLTVIDLKARKVARTIDLGEHRRPHGMAWLPGGRVAVTAEGSRHLLVVDPAEGKIVQAVPTGQEVSHMVVATPDGARAFVANIRSGSVTVIDLEKGEKIRDVVTGAGAEGIALSPDGREVWVGNRAADTLTVFDAASLEILATLPCSSFPIRAAFTPDGAYVLVSSARSGEIVQFDAKARKETARRKLDLKAVPGSEQRLFGDQFGQSPVPVGLVVAPDGKTAWVALTQSDVVVAFDPKTLEPTGMIRAGKEPDGMAYAGGAARAAVAE
jgi:YVTN family beta-propeller protein